MRAHVEFPSRSVQIKLTAVWAVLLAASMLFVIGLGVYAANRTGVAPAPAHITTVHSSYPSTQDSTEASDSGSGSGPGAPTHGVLP